MHGKGLTFLVALLGIINNNFVAIDFTSNSVGYMMRVVVVLAVGEMMRDNC